MVDLKNEAQSAIDAHGIIGDMRSAALINDQGSIDFFCWPEFDSPSIFCSLLDSPAAGIFQLTPDLPQARREQIYLPDTNVLQTRWLSDDAVVEITDLLSISDDVDDLPLLIRRVRVVSGKATLHLRCAVRHDYARAPTRATADNADVCFEAPGLPGLRLASSVPLQIADDAAVACFTLDQDQGAEFVLGDREDIRVASDGTDLHLQHTLKFWRGWLAQSNYRGRWREMVNRSALALKLLLYSPSGAIAAAATAALPERIGGDKNYDYRYAWIRDAAYTVNAFLRIGAMAESKAAFTWLLRQLRRQCFQPFV